MQSGDIAVGSVGGDINYLTTDPVFTSGVVAEINGGRGGGDIGGAAGIGACEAATY